MGSQGTKRNTCFLSCNCCYPLLQDPTIWQNAYQLLIGSVFTQLLALLRFNSPLSLLLRKRGHIHPQWWQHYLNVTCWSLQFLLCWKAECYTDPVSGISERCHVWKVFVANTNCLFGISVKVLGRLFQMKCRINILKSSPIPWACQVCVGQLGKFLPFSPQVMGKCESQPRWTPSFHTSGGSFTTGCPW